MTKEQLPSSEPFLARVAQGALVCIRFVWTWLIRLGQVLWACRISVFSAAVGLAVFGLVLQAQNLFADLSFSDFAHGRLHWIIGFAAIFLFWAFPIHYGARRILELEEKEWLVSVRMRRRLHLPQADADALYNALYKDYSGLILWTPRLLGMVPFVAVALGLWFADRAMDGALALQEADEAHGQIRWLNFVNLVTAALFFAFVFFRRPAIRMFKQRINERSGDESAAGKVDVYLGRFAAISLVGTTLIFFLAYVRPDWLAFIFPRALLIPFLFGSLVLIFSWLVRLGYKTGLPLAAFVIVPIVLSTATNTHLNDLRTLAPSKEGVADRQIDIKAAADRWKAANACTGADDCPPALIVASEGGASRAAFMMATVVGELIDRAKAAGDPADALNPGRRIFAISGVSGGAFAAAVTRAAIADSAETPAHAPPCLFADRTWFGVAAKTQRDLKTSWRACLQALVSGDYLSPVFVGLGFRDNFAPREWFVGTKSWIEDRAALLEEAWERHYDSVTTPGHGGHGVSCGDDGSHGLCRRFGYISATAGDWLPLLLLNGTSVETGRRIIVSDLASTRDSINSEGEHRPEALYAAAYDVFELLSAPREPIKGIQCGADGGRAGPTQQDALDIRLSTAAALSARFPIISPGGVLRVPTHDCYGDRVVDGGYFENSGLTTALDIAEALKRERVTSIILWVQNDPIIDRPNTVTPRRRAATPEVELIDEGILTEALGLLAQPVDTLLATREGHGAEAADLATRLEQKMNAANENGFFQIGVHANLSLQNPIDPVHDVNCRQFVDKQVGMTKVSMSWWLSAAVQSDLDAQMCDDRNRRSMRDLLARLSQRR
jgi:hypothetical protein